MLSGNKLCFREAVILLVTVGEGYYKEEGKPAQL
jgi:hypothetical protein